MTKKKAPPAAEQINERKLKSLLGSARKTYKDTRSAAGTLGEQIRSAVEHDHLHAKAFRSVVAEDRMEPEKLAEFYDAQEFYRDILGLNERASSAPKFEVIEGGQSEAAE
jgi:hypothetical protein